METCSKCQRRKVVAYRVELEEAWKTLMLRYAGHAKDTAKRDDFLSVPRREKIFGIGI
jgi:hypothetical protein